MEKTNDRRISWVDLASGIMIVWLLYYHALYPMMGYNIFVKIPWLFFFMPWFFYKSGYFFHVKNRRELLGKDFKKLIGNFIIWSFVGYICLVVHTLVLEHSISFRQAIYTPIRSLLLGGSVPMNSALWFLPVLFFVRQIANITFSRLKVIYVCLIAIVIAIAIHIVRIPYLPYYIYNTAWGLFFFGCGYLLKKYEEKPALVASSLIVVCFAFYYTDIPSVYKCEDFIANSSYILWYPVSVCGCILFNNICRWLDSCNISETNGLNWTSFPLLKYIGKHSMIFYVAHYPIFRIVFDYIAQYNEEWYSSWQGLLIITLAYSIIIFPIAWLIDRLKQKVV